MLLIKPIAVLTVTISCTVLFLILSQPHSIPRRPNSMARRSFILWLHGLGDSGPANEPIKTLFTSPEFNSAVWSFPSAPSNPVTCNCKFIFSFAFDFRFFFVFDFANCSDLIIYISNGYFRFDKIKVLICCWTQFMLIIFLFFGGGGINRIVLFTDQDFLPFVGSGYNLKFFVT